MNELLCKDFTAAEVKEALESIGDLKAPGVDGLPSIFYKKSWDIVGEKVTAEVIEVLNGGPMPEGWNDTCVVLIPKTKNPESMKDLRPISLCNVVYKLVSKVLANRLKQVLPEIISPNQSAFVPGRLIMDNILLAYECTHYMKNKRNGREGFAAVKLDMSKAYDRVDQDSTGQIRGSGAGALRYVASAAQAEAHACEQAARAAADWGMVDVILESDAQNLVRAMRSTEFDRTPEGMIYRDIRLYMQLHFNSWPEPGGGLEEPERRLSSAGRARGAGGVDFMPLVLAVFCVDFGWLPLLGKEEQRRRPLQPLDSSFLQEAGYVRSRGWTQAAGHRCRPPCRHLRPHRPRRDHVFPASRLPSSALPLPPLCVKYIAVSFS
ncbi:hypothetical protein QYE76_007075 [Lolium multiflorum]|uniref:Reverse transcriptase domain-containing protein n=1 Tax=Lolium multiflorum TaxID=4521 RepID=A0AAD8W2D1_LOLMU|nr:hypothetical protein QYE76_007075 [Lolium multiflorum]